MCQTRRLDPDSAMTSGRTAPEQPRDVGLRFGFAGYENRHDVDSESCRLHGKVASQNCLPFGDLFSQRNSKRLLVCAECLDVLLHSGQKKASKRRANGKLVAVFSVGSTFLKQILKRLCRIYFVSLEKPLVLFTLPKCCPKSNGISKDSFDSGFSAFIQLPEPLSFKRFLRLCRKIVAHRSHWERCICSSEKSNVTSMTAYLHLLLGVYLYCRVTEELDTVERSLERLDSSTKKYIENVVRFFDVRRSRPVKSEASPTVEEDAGPPRTQRALGFYTGKEEIDSIDGVTIVSFETESDLMEFTLLEKYNLRNMLGPQTTMRSGRIVPTKTKDITKIKGWRNKLFFTGRVARDYVRVKVEKPSENNQSEGVGEVVFGTICSNSMTKVDKSQVPFRIVDLMSFPSTGDEDAREWDLGDDYQAKWKKGCKPPVKVYRLFRRRFEGIDVPDTDSEPEVIEIESSDDDESSSPRSRPQLSLLQACKTDDDFEGYSSEASGVNKLPMIFPCSSESDDHSACFEGKEFSEVRLGMVLNVGYGRPLGQKAAENLELLREDSSVVDRRWATIAASAFCPNPNTNRTIKRFLVPVVSKELLEFGKNFLHILPETSDAASDVNEDTLDCSEVENVVSSLIDYVVRKEEFEEINIPSDPDVPSSISSSKGSSKKYEKTKVERELSRLINVTLVDEYRKDYSYKECGNDYCIKGCICHSLDGKVSVAHCRKESCMFDCTCHNKEEFTSGDFNRKNSLAKEESTWHQTVICKNNDVFEIRGEKSKSKRQKKLPTRFRNNVLLGREMSSVSPSTIINWRYPHLPSRIPAKKVEVKAKSSPGAASQSAKTANKSSKDVLTKNKNTPKSSPNNSKSSAKASKAVQKESQESPEKDVESPKNDSQTTPSKNEKQPVSNDPTPDVEAIEEVASPEVDTPAVSKKKAASPKKKQARIENQKEIEESKLKLGDAFIWCSIHFRYLCPCMKYLYLLKCNLLVWKPCNSSQHMTIAQMADLMRNNSNISTLHIYNRQEHSARTFGSVINYTKRNRSQTFKMKRAYEVEHLVLSCSNSFIKVDLPTRKSTHKSSSFSDDQEKAQETPPIKKPYNNQKNFDSQTFFSNIKTKKMNFNLNCDPKNLPRQIAQEDPENQEQTVNKKKYYRIGPKHFDSLIMNKSFRPTERPPKYSQDQLQMKATQKKKYRIGPKHFNNSGNYRTIVTKATARAGASGAVSQPVRNSLTKEDCITLEDSDSESYEVPEQGLLCLTRGFGYLAVKEYSHDKLMVQDPLASKVYHSFKDVEAANVWFNKFFKNRMLFEDLSVDLSWVLVKKGILLKSRPFDKSLLEKGCTRMINRDGILVDKTTRYPIEGDSFFPNVHRATSPQRLMENIVDLINIASNKRLLDDSSWKAEQPSKKIRLESISSLDEKTSSNCEPATLEPITIIGSPDSSTSTDEPHPKKSNSSFLRIDSSASLSEGCFIPLVSSDTNDKTPDVSSQNKVTFNKKNIVLARGLSSESSLLKQKKESLNK